MSYNYFALKPYIDQYMCEKLRIDRGPFRIDSVRLRIVFFEEGVGVQNTFYVIVRTKSFL